MHDDTNEIGTDDVMLVLHHHLTDMFFLPIDTKDSLLSDRHRRERDPSITQNTSGGYSALGTSTHIRSDCVSGPRGHRKDHLNLRK